MVKVDKITFSYDNKFDVLTDISLDIKKGSFVSIIGHNGSGKSTLSKLLVGLLKAKSGDIFIDDIKLTEKTVDEVRKKIGIVFQNPDNQFVGVTVKHDIAFGLENQKIPREEMIKKIDYYSKLVGMNDFLDKEPHQLSGGQKQRVAIASAIAMEQEVIIFDEATSMLDPEGTREIIDLIKILNKEHNKTIISITHELDLALKSDYVYVLNKGVITLEGTPLEVFKHETELKNSNLELPFVLKLYNDIKDYNEKMAKDIWEYILEM